MSEKKKQTWMEALIGHFAWVVLHFGRGKCRGFPGIHENDGPPPSPQKITNQKVIQKIGRAHV